MPAESVISADSHIQEPPELFSERLPKEFRHLAPWVEEREDGARYLHVEGKRPRRVDIAEARESEDDQHREFRNDPTGGRDIERRIEDQEVDGVSAVLDEQYDKKHMWIRPKLDLKPSEYFARQGHVTFSDDPMALRLLDFTGADKLMWGSDYPHDEGTFPHSQAVIERTFVGVPSDAKDKIVRGNAAALYGLEI